ncbi:MAG TPA: acetyl-CoA carboxylase biotin carboxylase subunit, partial [Polyangia bacterium]|nr:acetyl-CoA carboxylase biotin carboxylase subunit [Polyangia bacterium]
GAAIECRVYAEDPLKFLPSPGRITALRTPSGPFVRDDSGVAEGSEISVFYDPMISKLVAWAPTRREAIDRMARALGEYRVGGIKTNLAFHRRVMKNAAFREGAYSTAFIEQQKAELLRPLEPDEGDERERAVDAVLAAAVIHALEAEPPPQAAGDGARAATERSAWQSGRTFNGDA